jgi:hypothetical protein
MSQILACDIVSTQRAPYTKDALYAALAVYIASCLRSIVLEEFTCENAAASLAAEALLAKDASSCFQRLTVDATVTAYAAGFVVCGAALHIAPCHPSSSPISSFSTTTTQSAQHIGHEAPKPCPTSSMTTIRDTTAVCTRRISLFL